MMSTFETSSTAQLVLAWTSSSWTRKCLDAYSTTTAEALHSEFTSSSSYSDYQLKCAILEIQMLLHIAVQQRQTITIEDNR
ncbi:unnamed protein product [Gongylonema pulchrum]|uniref:Uncharacterized protein n=1 Tax=Gongylonema pulchrum TaxID=637853 RepID=A0A183D5K9_9BILA|nr:unnamed protein product [Gongylonema pulchrum]